MTATARTAEHPAANPRFELALPGVWHFVPLIDEAQMRAALDRLVRRSIGTDDKLAAQRRAVRARFEDAARSARTAGGHQLHICDEVMPGVPLPATLVVLWPGLTVNDDDETDDVEEGDEQAAEDAVRQRLAELLGPPADDEDESALIVGPRPAIRRSRITRGRPDLRGASASDAAPGDDVREIETVESRVYAIQPGGRVLILSFSCGMPALRDDLVAVFDLIAMTLQWVDEP